MSAKDSVRARVSARVKRFRLLRAFLIGELFLQNFHKFGIFFNLYQDTEDLCHNLWNYFGSQKSSFSHSRGKKNPGKSGIRQNCAKKLLEITGGGGNPTRKSPIKALHAPMEPYAGTITCGVFSRFLRAKSKNSLETPTATAPPPFWCCKHGPSKYHTQLAKLELFRNPRPYSSGVFFNVLLNCFFLRWERFTHRTDHIDHLQIGQVDP